MKPPDMVLGRFLTRLAVDDTFRASFESAPETTLDGLNPRLRPEVRDAILTRRRTRLFRLLNIANQSTGVPSPAKKVAKKAAKKSSAKK